MDQTGWTEADLAALGRVVVNFSAIDRCSEQILLAFLGTGLTPILVVAGEDIRWKLDKLRVIANETVIDQELKSRLLAWITATASLNERRNQLMHSVYTFEPGKPQPTRFKASARGGRWRGHAEPIESQSTELLASLLATGVDVANDLLESIHSGTLPSA